MPSADAGVAELGSSYDGDGGRRHGIMVSKVSEYVNMRHYFEATFETPVNWYFLGAQPVPDSTFQLFSFEISEGARRSGLQVVLRAPKAVAHGVVGRWQRL